MGRCCLLQSSAGGGSQAARTRTSLINEAPSMRISHVQDGAAAAFATRFPLGPTWCLATPTGLSDGLTRTGGSATLQATGASATVQATARRYASGVGAMATASNDGEKYVAL